MKKLVAVILLISLIISMAVTVAAEPEMRIDTPEDWAQLKQRVIAERQGQPQLRYGAYPTTPGYILVTDMDLDLVDPKSYTGHAGIILNAYETVEAFPFKARGVDYYDNNWNTRYAAADVYGLMVKNTNNTIRGNAANWAKSRIGVSNYIIWGDTISYGNVNCASLVYHSYKQAGITLAGISGTVVPMKLVDSSSTSVIYTNF